MIVLQPRESLISILYIEWSVIHLRPIDIFFSISMRYLLPCSFLIDSVHFQMEFSLFKLSVINVWIYNWIRKILEKIWLKSYVRHSIGPIEFNSYFYQHGISMSRNIQVNLIDNQNHRFHLEKKKLLLQIDKKKCFEVRPNIRSKWKILMEIKLLYPKRAAHTKWFPIRYEISCHIKSKYHMYENWIRPQTIWISKNPFASPLLYSALPHILKIHFNHLL